MTLETVHSAIAAELEQVKAGAAFYERRVAQLEAILAQLAIAQGNRGVAGEAPTRKRGRKPGKTARIADAPKRRGRPPKAVAVPAVVAPKAKIGRKAKAKGDLPFTGGDYWENLVSSQPKSAVQVLDAAISKLPFTATKEQRKKLQQRMVFALNSLAKEGRIKDVGSGRARQYYK